MHASIVSEPSAPSLAHAVVGRLGCGGTYDEGGEGVSIADVVYRELVE